MMMRPAILSLAAVLILSSCAPGNGELHVVQKVKSPDGSLTAAYVQSTPGGAPVGTAENVYVFAGDVPMRYSDRVFADECVNNVRVSWLGPRELRIAYGIRAGHEPTRSPGPWWTFGHVPHGLTVRFEPHLTKDTYC